MQNNEHIEKVIEQITKLQNYIEEHFLQKKEEIDFSILNDTDVFYIDCGYKNQFLFIGKDPTSLKVLGFDLSNNETFNNVCCDKKDVIELRKATDEEIALYRKHYPIKYKCIIYISQDIEGNLYTTLNNRNPKYKLIDTIEKEYYL